MNTHPEALRLADELDVGDFDVVTNYEAASELRRLHEENERLKAATPVQEPVKPSLWERYHEAQTTTPPAALVQLAWVWQQAPVKTQWGHDMVVADLAIDKDHTVSIYCELDQTSKVEAMFTPPAAPVQEPVAWRYQNANTDHVYLVWEKGTGGRNWTPLFEAPCQTCISLARTVMMDQGGTA